MTPDDPVLEVRRATVDEFPLIQDFVDATYGEEAPFKQEARLRWQFLDTPYRRSGETGPTVFVALSDGRVVGTIGVQDGCARVAGELVPMGWVVDVMVHPEFRGRGLGHRIHAAALADRPALITLTMADATRRIAERAGSMTLVPTREFVRPLRISPGTVRRFLSGKANHGTRRRGVIGFFNATRIGPVLLAAMVRLVGRLRSPVRPEQDLFDFEEVGRFPQELDDLWEHVADEYPALFERSTRFLNWRFADEPQLVYRRFLMRSGGVLIGYVITRAPTAVELPAGTIVDFLAAPGDSDGHGRACRSCRGSSGPTL